MVPILAGVAVFLLAFSTLFISALFQQATLTQLFETCALSASRALSPSGIYLDSTARISPVLASRDTANCFATLAPPTASISWTITEVNSTSVRIAGSQALQGPLTGLFAFFGSRPKVSASATATIASS